MILFFYNLGLLAALVIGSPWWLFRLLTTEKYRDGILERVGFVRRLEGAGERRTIWLHAVSVGEVLAVSRLVKALDEALPGYLIAVSTTTHTGQQLARERFGGNRVFYCPLDLPWAVKVALNARKPALMILAETEFWPNLLSGCYRRGVPVVVVNARISDRSWPRYWRLRRLWRPFLSLLTAVLAQTELDAGRLRAVGCGLERVRVAGNLKFDVRSTGDSEATKLIRSILGERKLIVAGSTLGGEEELLLAAWPELLKADPELAMLLAPRHPERWKAVGELLDRSGVRWRRRSVMGTTAIGPGEIVLLDSMGELASVYSLAALAFVGGSLVPGGGHNPLEPAQYGVATLMGTHYENFRAMVDELRAREAIRIVLPAELTGAMVALLRDPEGAGGMGARAQLVFEEQAGATARTVAVVRTILSSRGAD